MFPRTDNQRAVNRFFMALVGSIGAIILIGVIVTLPGILGTIPTQLAIKPRQAAFLSAG